MLRERPQNQNSFVSQILLPLNALINVKTHAFLIGWNLENFRCCVTCVVELPADQYENLNSCLQSATAELQQLFMACSKTGTSTPTVLGEWIPDIPVGYNPIIANRMKGIWITLTKKGSMPNLHSLYSLGCLYNTSCYVFEYKPVNTDHLHCLNADQKPLRLSFEADSSIALHSELDFIVAQINAAHDLQSATRFHLQAPNQQRHERLSSSRDASVFGRLRGSVSAVNRVVSTLPSWLWYSATKRANHVLHYKLGMFSLGAVFAHWLGIRGSGGISPHVQSGGSSNSDGQAPSGESQKSAHTEGISLCDVSLTATFISERIVRFEACFRKCALFPGTWSLPPQLRQSLWVGVHSLLWVLWLDVLLGSVVGYFVYLHAEEIVAVGEQTCFRAQQHFIVDAMKWFGQSPGGIKLNSLITTKVGAALRTAVSIYHTVLVDTKALHLPVVKLLACFGALGVTAQLALLVDVMRLVTLHIATIHRVLSFFHQMQLQLLYSCWLLFQGQKRNVLRGRVDTCECDQSQLLFGIGLFSVALFFFPSFAIFYYLFAFAQFGVVLVQYVLWSSAVAIKELPLYSFALYALHPSMVTKGMQFDILHLQDESQPVQSVQSSVIPSSISASFVSASSVFSRADSSSTSNTSSAATTSLSSPMPKISEAHTPLGSAEGFAREKQSRERGIIRSGTTSVDSRGAATDVRGILKVQQESGVSTPRNQGRSGVHFNTSVAAVKDLRQEAEDAASGDEALGYSTNSISIISPNNKYEEHLEHSELQLPPQLLTKGNAVLPPFRGPLTDPLMNSGSSGNPPRATAVTQRVPDRTVHMSLVPRPLSLGDVFAGYVPYLQYMVSEEGFFLRLFRGVFLGRPALDIQLIHATASLTHKRCLAEQREIDSAFDAVRLRAAATQKSSAGRTRRQSVGFAASVYEGFQPLGVFGSGTVKNRKAPRTVADSSGGRIISACQGVTDEGDQEPRLQGSTSDDGLSVADFLTVYDLPQEGHVISSSFWGAIQLAMNSSSNTSESADHLDPFSSFEFASDVSVQLSGSHSSIAGSRNRRRVNSKQRSLSRWLLYAVLITASVNSLLASIGCAAFLGSLVPARWKMHLVRALSRSAVVDTHQQHLSDQPESKTNKPSLAINTVNATLRATDSTAATPAAAPSVAVLLPNKVPIAAGSSHTAPAPMAGKA